MPQVIVCHSCHPFLAVFDTVVKSDWLEIIEKEKPAGARVYFISDFQKSEWEQPKAELLEVIKKLKEKTELVFVNSGDQETGNLSVQEIRCLQEAVKVGETALFTAKVKNHLNH